MTAARTLMLAAAAVVFAVGLSACGERRIVAPSARFSTLTSAGA